MPDTTSAEHYGNDDSEKRFPSRILLSNIKQSSEQNSFV